MNIYSQMANETHILIGGCAGSGKSVLVNNFIFHNLLSNPKSKYIFIDPKKVELKRYQKLPQCISYTDTVDGSIKALNQALSICDKRYRLMQRKGLLKSEEPDIYIIIDELADLMTTSRRYVQPLIQRIAQIGRAARLHIVACTQCPLAKVIPTEIKVNLDCKVGLRTRSNQDSRNIIGHGGLENLPRYGQIIYDSPDIEEKLFNVSMVDGEEIKKLIEFYAHPIRYAIKYGTTYEYTGGK